jgi:hypothetical protein
MTPRPFTRTLALLFVTVVAGLPVRLVPLGLPAAVVKYGGSTLWAVMIYWIVSTLLPTRRLLIVALISGCIATAVEFFKLYHSPGMDAFRLTLPACFANGHAGQHGLTLLCSAEFGFVVRLDCSGVMGGFRPTV